MSRLLALLGLLLVLSFSAFAEIEIIVTASRVEEDARTAPAYVRVISDEEIARGNTVLDALLQLPDLSLKATSPGKEFISAGGFGENGFARILILINGKPVNRVDMAPFNWRTIPLDRIERIEVVKGALSSQYGDQAVAGAVNIILKNPKELEFWIRNDFAVNGSNHQSLGMGWGSDSLTLEAGVNREDLKPTREESDSNIISTNFDISPTFGIFDLGFSGRFSEAVFELPGGLTKDQYESDPDFAVNKNDNIRERRYGLNLDFALKPSKFSLNGNISWNRLDSDEDIASFASFTKRVLDDIQGRVQGDFDIYLSDQVVLMPIIGLDARYSTMNVKIYEESAYKTLKSDESPNRMNLGFWLRSKVLFGEFWTLDAGARLSYSQTNLNDDNSSSLPIVFDAGLSYVPGDNWAFSFRYGRVFRYPTLDEQASYNGFGPTAVNKDLDPEYGHNLTASVEFRKDRFRASLAPYFLAMTDEIAYVAVYDDSGKFVSGANQNYDSTYHFGTVAMFSWTGKLLEAQLSYSYDRAQFVESSKLIPLVPVHTIFSRLMVHPIKSLDVYTDARFSSGYYMGGDKENTSDMIPGRFAWNFGVEWRLLNDEFTLFGRVLNILDDRTPTAVFFNAWYPSEGRVIQIGASWKH